jgi:hypothetical protein
MSYEDDLVKCESAGRHAGRLARRRPEVHARVLAFLEELLAPSGPAHSPAPAPARERALTTR